MLLIIVNVLSLILFVIIEQTGGKPMYGRIRGMEMVMSYGNIENIS